MTRPTRRTRKAGAQIMLKRKADNLDCLEQGAIARSTRRKRRSLPPESYYENRAEEIFERDDLILPGETTANGLEADSPGASLKPIRVLTDFSIFDPSNGNELLSLAVLEDNDGPNRHFEGAGLVSSYFLDDEYEGYEEDDTSDTDRNDSLYIRLGAILRYYLDFTETNEPIYIETECAWYILGQPSQKYSPYYRQFYTPRRIAQIVVSSAISRPEQRIASFLSHFTNTANLFGSFYQEEDLWESLSEIEIAIEEYEEAYSPNKLGEVPIIQFLMRRAKVPQRPTKKSRGISSTPSRWFPSRKSLATGKNRDVWVLRPENQNRTHVTQLIANLAKGLVQEEFVVMGPKPSRTDVNILETQTQATILRLWQYIQQSRHDKTVRYRNEDVMEVDSRYLKGVTVNDTVYKVGDFIIVPIDGGPSLPQSLDEVPPTSDLDEYFWFAQIRYIQIDNQTAHIQWLEHGRQIFLGDLANPRELFFNDLCGHIPLHTIVAKIPVHYAPTHAIPHDEYYYKFKHNKSLSSFEKINLKNMALAADYAPPENCPNCLAEAQKEHHDIPLKLHDDNGDLHGLAFNGVKYHLNDFVKHKAQSGPASIGKILGINFPESNMTQERTSVTIRRVGRISDLERILPPAIPKDEHHLFVTDEVDQIAVLDLLGVVLAIAFEAVRPSRLKRWLSLSPDHFYVRYRFPSMNVQSWDMRRRIVWKKWMLCTSCFKERMLYEQDLLAFLKTEEYILSTLDLFGGVGALSRGLAEGSGCLKVSHAIEISPSAAKTFMFNNPDTVMYNQCVNTVLEYAIKSYEGYTPVVPRQIYDENSDKLVPAPPKPGDIQVICAGFPCQSHSGLNMFKHTDDLKNNLIFVTLSWIDFLRPKFCFLENVPGFLKFSLSSTQASHHCIKDRISMGGLKFTVRALLDMGYQVRFGLLQAAHYGTPQCRVRFFLVASLGGYPLPNLPQPTHNYPDTQGLHIKLPDGNIINPICVAPGTANYQFVSVGDAIGDLPRFDWQGSSNNHQDSEHTKTIPAYKCTPGLAYCGLEGTVQYHHPPRNSYQLQARRVPTTNLQQYTKCLLPSKVDRVVSIPLASNADYRELRTDQYEWQFANPSSSVGRSHFRPGLYGRLDENGVFPTTVTNVDPTAKQSRVLSPYCKRIVTVRELARSQGFPDHFVFKAVGDDVTSMHRQIGNAVPLPLGAALGRELRNALFEQWKNSERDG